MTTGVRRGVTAEAAEKKPRAAEQEDVARARRRWYLEATPELMRDISDQP